MSMTGSELTQEDSGSAMMLYQKADFLNFMNGGLVLQQWAKSGNGQGWDIRRCVLRVLSHAFFSGITGVSP